jgi:nickel superoxide dismutase
MKRTGVHILAAISIVLFAASYAAAHCEIPCGIYDDDARFKLLGEHITTIEKSMKMILELQSGQPTNHNQLTRWVMNKENHANQIQDIVTQYFMTQRIKVDTADYSKKLILLHKMLVHAMKCKQTTDLSQIGTLRSLLNEFHDLYSGHGHK